MIIWFRRDLRIENNPAWTKAVSGAVDTGSELTALFCIDQKLCAASADFQLAILRSNLEALQRQLAGLGGTLRVEIGDAAEQVSAVAATTGAKKVFANSDTTPYCQKRDRTAQKRLSEIGVDLNLSNGNYFHKPGSVLTTKATLSKVFTPFYNAWKNTVNAAWPEPSAAQISALTIASVKGSGRYEQVISDEQYHSPVCAQTVQRFGGGSPRALERLDNFSESVDDYTNLRDFPSREATSCLSADLALGTISARRIVEELVERHGPDSVEVHNVARQLAWRDWYSHLLAEYPDMARKAIKDPYQKIAWRNNPDDIEAWKAGQTGYPIVDAAMRELKETGWMHNRLRMVTGSFLVKHLLVDWCVGEEWFKRQLVDFDDAQNAGNWQWVAGCGTDAAPYFRVFNPTLQSKKFDPEGEYIRRWVSELAALEPKAIHEPAARPPLELAAAGVILGDTYPYPIVDHKEARLAAIATYKEALSDQG